MSYEVTLIFDPPIERQRFARYLSKRRHFFPIKVGAVYHNSNTGVELILLYKPTGLPLMEKRIRTAAFRVGLHRPSYFGLEAEIELSALVAEFSPKILDRLTKGMGAGPYSGEHFLSVWNYYRLLVTCSFLEDGLTGVTMPESVLRAAWEWNYRIKEREKMVGHWQFIPRIEILEVEGTANLAAMWPPNTPILLPKVDYVAPARLVNGERRFGLCRWSEIVDLARRSGFEVNEEPVSIKFRQPPELIAQFFSEFPLVERYTLKVVQIEVLIDSEVLETARRTKFERAVFEQDFRP